MNKAVTFLLSALSFAAFAGCNLQQPTSAERPSREQIWQEKLATYESQIDQVRVEIEGVKNLAEIFGQGAGDVQGDGTFVGDGIGTATLSGVGIVTGELNGTVMVQGTTDVDAFGFEYLGNNNGRDMYRGAGFFTATSDAGQQIEVVVDGDCWVIGAGTGVVFYSGEGWAFWYH
jgi:hypothetical protein